MHSNTIITIKVGESRWTHWADQPWYMKLWSSGETTWEWAGTQLQTFMDFTDADVRRSHALIWSWMKTIKFIKITTRWVQWLEFAHFWGNVYYFTTHKDKKLILWQFDSLTSKVQHLLVFFFETRLVESGGELPRRKVQNVFPRVRALCRTMSYICRNAFSHPQCPQPLRSRALCYLEAMAHCMKQQKHAIDAIELIMWP